MMATARRFAPPWSVEEQGVSNRQMWPYYINTMKAVVRKRSENWAQLLSWCQLLVALSKAGP
jgi:hypothetical protein